MIKIKIELSKIISIEWNLLYMLQKSYKNIISFLGAINSQVTKLYTKILYSIISNFTLKKACV